MKADDLLNLSCDLELASLQPGVPKLFGEQRQERVLENYYRLMPSA